MSVVDEAAQLVEDAVPFTGPIVAVASVVDDGIKLISPAVQHAAATAPLRAYIERLQEYEKIIDNPNDGLRGQQLGNFINQLCLDAGIPVGLISDRTVRVPLEHFTALIQAVGQLIEEREQATAASSKSVTK